MAGPPICGPPVSSRRPDATCPRRGIPLSPMRIPFNARLLHAAGDGPRGGPGRRRAGAGRREETRRRSRVAAAVSLILALFVGWRAGHSNGVGETAVIEGTPAGPRRTPPAPRRNGPPARTVRCSRPSTIPAPGTSSRRKAAPSSLLATDRDAGRRCRSRRDAYPMWRSAPMARPSPPGSDGACSARLAWCSGTWPRAAPGGRPAPRRRGRCRGCRLQPG